MTELIFAIFVLLYTQEIEDAMAADKNDPEFKSAVVFHKFKS